MPRVRRYASTIVPVIGCDMVNSRRADSGDPAGEDAGWCFGRLEIGFGPWLVQKASGFVGNVVEIGEAAGRADDIEQVAVFAGCCNAAKAASGERFDASISTALATPAGETLRPMMRLQESIWSRHARVDSRQALPDR